MAAHVSWLQGKLERQEASEIIKGVSRGPMPLPHPNTDSRALGSPLCLAESKVLLVVFKGWVSCCMYFESKIGVPVIPGLGGMGQVEAAHFTGQGGDPAVEGHFPVGERLAVRAGLLWLPRWRWDTGASGVYLSQNSGSRAAATTGEAQGWAGAGMGPKQGGPCVLCPS